jgi:hypothetical protein
MFDARGYHDDPNHVPAPPPKMEFMSAEWRRLLKFTLTEANRLGLEVSVNLSSCAGALKGPWEVGEDAPKKLVWSTGGKHYRDIATVPVGETTLRFGYVTMDGHEHDVDVLAGFTVKSKEESERFKRDYYKTLGDCFRENFYGTLRRLSNEAGLKWHSESGGPWNRKLEAFAEADQFAFLAENDMPQCEFWYPKRSLNRPSAITAHIYGKPLAATEAFTHMVQHWSVYPAALKPIADRAFYEGINHLIWHTFTASPTAFGKPGIEYFAGTHINPNVTWFPYAGPFITYLGRCQFMLRQGKPVVDVCKYVGDRPYLHWDQGAPNCDILTTEVLMNRLSVKDGKLVLPDGMSYRSLVVDLKAETAPPAVLKKLAELSKVNTNLPPDFEGPFRYTHRRTDDTDIYFVAGSGDADCTFRVTGTKPELWDAVTGAIRDTDNWRATADGRTLVPLSLPTNGSVFVVFRAPGQPRRTSPPTSTEQALSGPWQVSFGAKSVLFDSLVPWNTHSDPAIKFHSGAATYRKTLDLPAAQRVRLHLGDVKHIAQVRLNGQDLGVVWTAPWSVDLGGTATPGRNELEITVVNTWVNRLIGDAALPPEKRTTKTNVKLETGKRTLKAYQSFASEDPLMPSGLLGPVRLEFVK